MTFILNVYIILVTYVCVCYRGVFLTCLIYSEEKILVTFDDVLPTFQIDEDLSSSFQSDFHWLHKVMEQLF